MNIEESIALKKITFYFTILSALFLILSSQFTGFLLPLLFVLPIYMGLIGIKQRRKSGYLIGIAIVPIAFAISVLWIRYSISVFADRINQIAKISEQYNISSAKAGAFTTIFFALSIALVSICVVFLVKLLRHKEIFT
ncbi:hypothetical protein K9O30_11325 [Clostridium bowmanii]|uniref:hypothetical protein n=1 Tax=Clostridium bowmanii TaxID=132925 RepID=UPI001C0AB9DA|nr:hypothetical protein [Clostridium bowmanii]MBU3189817.1 hypothetical protein [Clostridium bowmanii]MCA1074301.1 hypothetical protein [Clostridium bowmanii]